MRKFLRSILFTSKLLRLQLFELKRALRRFEWFKYGKQAMQSQGCSLTGCSAEINDGGTVYEQIEEQPRFRTCFFFPYPEDLVTRIVDYHALTKNTCVLGVVWGDYYHLLWLPFPELLVCGIRFTITSQGSC